MGAHGTLRAIAVLVALAACDGGGTPSPDAGTADAATDAPTSRATLPAPPAMTPCPKGWTEVTSATGTVTCDPWPATGRGDCSGDQAHFMPMLRTSPTVLELMPDAPPQEHPETTS